MRNAGAQRSLSTPWVVELDLTADSVGPATGAGHVKGGDDGTRTHDPLLAKQVL